MTGLTTFGVFHTVIGLVALVCGFIALAGQGDLRTEPSRAGLSRHNVAHRGHGARNLSSWGLGAAPCVGGAHSRCTGSGYGCGDVPAVRVGVEVRSGHQLLVHHPLPHDPGRDRVIDALATGSASGGVPGCSRVAGRLPRTTGGLSGRDHTAGTFAAQGDPRAHRKGIGVIKVTGFAERFAKVNGVRLRQEEPGCGHPRIDLFAGIGSREHRRARHRIDGGLRLRGAVSSGH